MSKKRKRLAFAGQVVKEVIALPGTLDDLKVWGVIGGPPLLLLIGHVREWLMDKENVHLALKTFGVAWPLGVFLVIRFRSAWKRAAARARALDIGYTRYVAIREDNIFGPSDFLNPDTSSASKTDTLRIPRYTGARYVALAAPAFLADPVSVELAAQGLNSFNSFEEIPGVFDLDGVEYRAWRSITTWNEIPSEEVLVVKQRLPPKRLAGGTPADLYA